MIRCKECNRIIFIKQIKTISFSDERTKFIKPIKNDGSICRRCFHFKVLDYIVDAIRG